MILEVSYFLSKRDKHVYPILDAMLALKKENLGDMKQLLGIGNGTINRKFTGQRDFTFSEATCLSEHFGLPTDFLLSKDEKTLLDAVGYFLKKEEVV